MPTRVAVIGAGTIGPDIGYYLSAGLGCELVLVDIDQGALDEAAKRIESLVNKGLARNKLSSGQARRVLEGLTTTLDYAQLAGSQWVIEAATENLELKRKIFAEIEEVVADDAVITSNTSSLPASWLFSGMSHPRRATVTHFFAPAFRNPVVEVVDWEAVDEGVVDDLRRWFAATDKVPLITADVPCFMLDRIFDNWCNEAGYLLEQATPAQIDTVAMELVVAGPFFVLNLADGNRIITETDTLQAREEGAHYRPAPVFASDPRWETVSPGQGAEVDPELRARIRDRLLGILFSQTVDILDRGIGLAEDLELGCELALGFEVGPLRLMERLGEAGVERILGRLAAERPGMPMPARALGEYHPSRRHLVVDDVDGVKVITLRRPGALNALDDEVNAELLDVLREHEEDSATVGFVITGYGERAFCAGADISRFPEMLGDVERCAQYARECSRVLVHLDSMTKPVVAALNGMALGGGLELAMRCHGIVARNGAWLQLPEVTLGIAPGIGALVVPYRRWPAAAPTFHDMLRTGARITAEDAHREGIIDVVVPQAESLLEAAMALVGELVGEVASPPGGPVEVPPFSLLDPPVLEERGLSAEVVGIIEEAVVSAAAAPTLADALEIGYAAFAATASTSAARDGITTFLSRGKG
jgi:enoyl-CoA hydratase/3-hydroxyacyl-CoA dehydrogenase